jgi:hypothetical protein
MGVGWCEKQQSRREIEKWAAGDTAHEESCARIEVIGPIAVPTQDRTMGWKVLLILTLYLQVLSFIFCETRSLCEIAREKMPSI